MSRYVCHRVHTRHPSVLENRSRTQGASSEGLNDLEGNKLFVKFSKCEFWLRAIVEVVTEWARLTTVTEVCNFQEFVGY